METAWNVHGNCMETALTCIGSAVAGGLSEGSGSIPKGIWLPWSGDSVLDHDLKRRCTPEGVRRIVRCFASSLLSCKWLESGVESNLRVGRIWKLSWMHSLGALRAVLEAFGQS